MQDNYCIVIFNGSERMLKGTTSLKSHVTFVDGRDRPSDQYLRLHFQWCLTVCACGGNPTEDYKDKEIDLFMEELGVYDDEMDTTDPRWMTPLGVEVYASAYLVRQKMAEWAVSSYSSNIFLSMWIFIRHGIEEIWTSSPLQDFLRCWYYNVYCYH